MQYSEKKYNHKLWIDILRKMTSEEKLVKAFEMTEFARDLFKIGLKKRFPDKSEEELNQIYLRRIQKCHNRNY